MVEVELVETVRAAVSGNQNAWDSLVASFSGMVWGIARGQGLSHPDAADVSQTVWLRLAEHIARLREPERLGGWLATTARNESLRVLRRRQYQVPLSHERLVQLPEFDTRPIDAGLIAREESSQLWQAFEQIPGPCRVLLRMLMNDPPPSYSLVSEALGMPIGSIGPRRARCLDHLRGQVERISSGAPPGPVCSKGVSR